MGGCTTLNAERVGQCSNINKTAATPYFVIINFTIIIRVCVCVCVCVYCVIALSLHAVTSDHMLMLLQSLVDHASVVHRSLTRPRPSVVCGRVAAATFALPYKAIRINIDAISCPIIMQFDLLPKAGQSDSSYAHNHYIYRSAAV